MKDYLYVNSYNFQNTNHVRINMIKVDNEKDFYEKLVAKIGKRKANRLFNQKIMKLNFFSAYCLEVITGHNFLINVQDYEMETKIIKRKYTNNDYSEIILDFDFRKMVSHLYFRSSKKESLEEVVDYNILEIELGELLKEINILPIGIHIITDNISIINGFPGQLEAKNSEISLYSNRSLEDKITELDVCKFFIVNNITRKVVGYINFDFEVQNIAYRIYEAYRGNHYASKALKLMLDLIKDSEKFQEYNLYVRIYNDNIASLKTASSCFLPIESVDNGVTSYVVNPKLLLTNPNN